MISVHVVATDCVEDIANDSNPNLMPWRGMGALVDQVLVAGSYASTVATETMVLLSIAPPITYRMPFTTPAPAAERAVGMGARVVHELDTGS